MAGTSYNTIEQRVAIFVGRTLKRAMAKEVIGRLGFGSKERLPKNASDTVVFRRWLPAGADSANPNRWVVDPSTYLLTEGETPNTRQIKVQDIKVTLSQYGVIYRFTDRLADFHQDDVPARFKDMVGDECGLMREKIRWGVLRAGTNVYRAGNVASRSLVNGLITPALLRNISRGLSNQRATQITSILKASVDVGTEPVEGGWVALCHTNLKADIRAALAPDFIHVSEYGTHVGGTLPEEFGSWEDFRFCASVELDPYLLAGATAPANTRLSNGVPNSAGTELCDVYPIVVLSEDAYGDVMLRGEDALTPTFIPAGRQTKDDPLGQRGFVGAKFYFAVVRLNEGHLAIAEVACSALPG